MLWLQRFESRNGLPSPILLDEDGHERNGTLTEFANQKNDGYKLTELKELDLASLELADGAVYLKAFGLHAASCEHHQVFVVRQGSMSFLIPAAVLVAGFVMPMTMLGAFLLSPTGLSQSVVPIVRGGEARAGFTKKTRYRGCEHRHAQHRMLWFSCFPSANRFWSSVYQNAAQGRMAVWLPRAQIDATVVGRKFGEFGLVSRIQIQGLRPREAPYPFADGLACATFNLDREAERVRGLLASRNLGATKLDIPMRDRQWKMNDDEWRLVVRALKMRRSVVKNVVRSNIDLALEQLGAGRHWRELGPNWRATRQRFYVWRRNGDWDTLINTLRQVREGSTGEVRHECPSKESQGSCHS